MCWLTSAGKRLLFVRAHTERLYATSPYRGVKVDGIFLDPDITGAHLRRVKAHDGVQREAD